MKRATSRLAVLLYFVAAAIFVGGYVAAFVHPRFAWWLQLLGVFLPYSAGLMVFLSPPVFFSKRRWLKAVQVVVLVAVFVRFPPWAFVHSGSPADGDLRLMSYNTPGIQTREDLKPVEAARDLVTTYRPDVIALQEVYWRYAFGGKAAAGRGDYFLLELDNSYVSTPASIDERVFTHQPVLARTGLRRVDHHEFRMTGDQEDPTDVLVATAEWQGREFKIFNIHLASYGAQKPWHEEDSSRFDPFVWRGYMQRYRSAILRRAWEAEQIRELIESEEGPFLVSGDFNATPHNWSFRKIAAGLRDAHDDAGNGAGFTYHRRRPIVRIDFVLGTDDFRFTSARSVDGHVSDHLGLFVTLRWRVPPHTSSAGPSAN